jgi:protein-L-isoaspartate(D-aspartate) O-methyltransferase
MSEESAEFTRLRAQMVERQLRQASIRDPAVLQAMASVPRECFVPASEQAHAYEDRPLAIPAGQSISQPYIVAYMISALALKPTDRVLEIGTGSGYEAAVLSLIAQEVFSVEREAELVHYARQRLGHLGYSNVQVYHGDGTLGWPEHAPYDAIIVSAGGPDIPLALRQQLAVNGRLVIPVGRHLHRQRLVKITRLGADEFKESRLSYVSFVPLVGAQGWEDADEPWWAYFKP